MCNPAVFYVAMAAIAAAGSYYSIDQSNRNAQAQIDAASDAAKHDYDALNQRKGEIDEQAAQEVFQRRLQTSREHGMAMVALGEAGVGGNSAMRILGNTLLQGAYDVNRIKTGAENQRASVLSNMDAIRSGAQGRINIAASQKIGGLGATTAVAGAALDGYTGSGGSFGSSSSGKKLKTFKTGKG